MVLTITLTYELGTISCGIGYAQEDEHRRDQKYLLAYLKRIILPDCMC